MSWEQAERMESVGDVKRYLFFLIRQVRCNKVSVRKANCLGQLCNTVINAIVDHELEQRIAELESSRAASWHPSQNQVMTIRAGGSHATQKKPIGTA